MKLKFLAILATLTAFTINAQEVEQIIGYISTPKDDARLYMRFDKLSDTECQFASPRNIKLINTDAENPTLLDLVMDTPEQERFENNIIVSGPLYIFRENGFPTTIKTDEGDEYKVVGIGDFAFARAALESMTITIPDNYKIGKGAFFQSQIGGVKLNNTTSIPDYCFYNTPISNIDFKDVITIGKYAFAQSSLSPTNFGKVTTIEDYAFGGCTAIYSLEILDPVKTIGKGAFYLCSNMNPLKIGDSVERIEESAFSMNTSLYTVELGNNLSFLGEAAFKACGSLKILTFAQDGVLETISESAFEGCHLGGYSQDYVLEIPGYIKTIGKSAFKNCAGINSIKFNDGLETICESAFEGDGTITTTAEKPIKFPDSLITIEEAAFKDCKSAHNIVFGKNLQEIGDYAFYKVDIVLSPFYLPSTITKIGYDAINFTNTNSSFTDIFYPNSTPNDIDEEAFGRLGGEDVKFNDDYWIYLTVCLHVPMGTRELYENCTGWRNFKCIIDDLIPEKTPESDPTSHTDGDDPLTYIIGYAYIKPGDELNINKDVLKLGEDTQTQLRWKRIVKGTKPSENQGDNSQSGNQQNGQDLKESEEVIYEENPVVTMDSDGNVTAEKYGDKIVIAYRDGNIKVDGSGNETKVEQTVAGAVILFVCPTITLVYDTKNETAQPGASQSLSRIRTLAEGDGTTEDEITPVVNEATEVAQLKEDNATYEHLVVYNSYPKLMLEPASGITISDIQRAKIDQNNNYTADGALADIDKEEQLQNDGLVENAQYIVPINPVQENRVITFSGISNDDQLTTEVEDEVIQLTPEIKVVVNGLTISIEGAQPESVVTVTNTNGQVVYNAKGKTFTMTTKGVYIVRVEDVTFKALVK